MKQSGIFLVVIFGLSSLFLACENPTESITSSFEHVVVAADYTDHTTYLTFRYEDDRFNETDWFDTRQVTDDGVYRWEEYRDTSLDKMLYQPAYGDGYVTWDTYPADLDLIVGITLRFYQIKVD